MLEESLKLSTIGFAALDKDGIIAYANVAFCKMFAFTSPEAAAGISLVEHVGSILLSHCRSLPDDQQP